MASSFTTSDGTCRNTRVCRLLVDLCPCLLRDILRHDLPESKFEAKLKSKEGFLKNKLLNKSQCDLLFPAPGQYYNNDYREFDVSLLYTLIRNLCSYKAHSNGWGKEPDGKDVSISACVERIRIARNTYVGHMSRFDMDGPTFLSIWAEIKQVVVELEKILSPTEKNITSNTSYEIEMDTLETDPLDPELEQMYRKKFEEQETALREADENVDQVRKQMEEKSRALRDAEENVDNVRKNILAKTKSRISNHRNNSCYIATNAVQAITDQLEQNNIAIVAGCPGSGKTTTILEVMTNLSNKPNESFTPAIIDNPENWDRVVNSSERMIIFLDDPMGKSNFDILNFVKWEKQFKNMISCSNYGKCFIVIAIRDHVLEEMNKVCRPNNLFTKQSTMSVSKGKFKLDENEKMKMLMKYQITNNRELSDKDKCVILKSQPYYGFPQTCFLFFTNDSLFELGVSFFTRPDKTLVNEIEKLRKSDSRAKNLQYYVLVYVLINKTINMQSSETCVVTEINRLANLTNVESIEIKDRIEELDDVYLILSEGSDEELMFRHETIKEAVLISYFRVNPKLIIKNCCLSDLGELIRTDTYRTKDQEVVLKVGISEYQDIIDRYMGFDSSYVELLQCCVFNEWLGILEILFEKDDTLVNKTDSYGMTLITYAALWKKRELVKYLYDNKANVKHVNKFGSCLHFCTLNEWTELLDIIFTDDPTLVDQKNAHDMSLIEYAAKNTKKVIVMYLYKKNANIKNDFQLYTFLKYCVDNNWHGVLSVILETNQTLINVKVTPSHSLITYAASQKNIEIVKHLLQHTNTETDLSDPVYLLQICVDNDWFDLLDTLLKDWSSLVNKANKDGLTLICYAAQWDKKRMVEFLMQHGAEHNSINFLENCVDNELTDILENVINRNPSLLNVNMAGDGFTLICYAASQRSIPIIDLLLDNIADIHTSLFLNVCVDNELKDVIKRVIIKQPDLVNCTNPSGETLICYAAKQMQSEIVLLLIDQGASIEQDDLTRRHFIQLCVDNKWENVLDKMFQMYPSVVDINRAFGSTLFAYDTPEQMVTFLYAYIPHGSLSRFYIHSLFQNFVLKRRFRALELFMRDYPECSSFENAFYEFERIMLTEDRKYKQQKVHDDDVYKILCIDQSLVDDKTASPTFRYCLEKRTQVIILYIESHHNVNNIHLDGNSLIVHSAIGMKEEIVLRLIYPWTNDINTSNDDMIILLGHCIDNKWDGVILKMMKIDLRLKPFLKDNGLKMMMHAFDKEFYNITNIIFQNTMERTDDKDICFMLFKKLVDNGDVRLISVLLQHEIKREYIHNSKGESLLTYVALSNKRQLTKFLVKKLAFEDFLGIDIEALLQRYIENDWYDILKIILSKTYKLVTNAKLGEIISYAFKNNNKELIVSLLEYEIDHKMISLIAKHCIDHKWFDVLLRILNEDKNIANVMKCDEDDILMLFKQLVDNGGLGLISAFVQNNNSKYMHNSKGESLLTYVASGNNRQLSMFLAEQLAFEDFLGTDIEHLLQKYIENDWYDILKIILSKTYKLVTSATLGEIISYAFKNNNKELIVSLLEYEIDHKMISLIAKHCIDHKWFDVLLRILNEDKNIANVMKCDEDDIFMLFKQLVDNGGLGLISAFLQNNNSKYIHNSKGESLLTYVASGNNRQLSMFLAEQLAFEDFLGTDIEHLLQKYIERDWDDILKIILSKTYKLVTNGKLVEIIRYAIRNNKKELIVSLLEYEIDHTMISLITKHCIDHEWCDVLQMILNEDKEIVNVLECDDLPIANYVARYGKEAIMEQLHLSNKVNFEYFDKCGYTPLHYCAAKGWTSIVDIIVKQIPSSSVQTQNGVDCAHFAAFFGRYAMLKMFICKGHKLNKTTAYGCNIFEMVLLGLRYASSKSFAFPFRKKSKSFFIDIFEKELIQINIDGLFNSQEYENVLLHTFTYISTTRYISANIFVKPIDTYGNSILHYLVINDNQTIVKWMLEREDKLKLVKNVSELPSVLHIAAYLGRSNLVKMFVKCGVGAICDNESLIDAVKTGRKFAGQVVHHSPSGWINHDRIFLYDIKLKAVKYVEFQFGKDEEFDTIIRESLSVRL